MDTIRVMQTDSPDPIGDPAGYQRHLLGLLGDDDPATVRSATAASVRALLRSAGTDAGVPPEPTGWSVVQCLAHMTDAELVVSGRCRWILAHDRPPLTGYDQDGWVDELHRPPEPAEELLAVFEPLRAANIALWYGTPHERRIASGSTPSMGPRATS